MQEEHKLEDLATEFETPRINEMLDSEITNGLDNVDKQDPIDMLI